MVTLRPLGYGTAHSYEDYLRINKLLGEVYSQEDLDELMHHKDVRRGDISIGLTSPSGSHSLLLPRRPNDFINTEGFTAWPLMSIHHWGEIPHGQWLLNVSFSPPHSHGVVRVDSVALTLYGTREVPQAVRRIPPRCHQSCSTSCAARGARFCDSCLGLRNATTLECIQNCPKEFKVHSGYCLNLSLNDTYSFTPSVVAMTTQPTESDVTLTPPLQGHSEGLASSAGFADLPLHFILTTAVIFSLVTLL